MLVYLRELGMKRNGNLYSTFAQAECTCIGVDAFLLRINYAANIEEVFCEVLPVTRCFSVFDK